MKDQPNNVDAVPNTTGDVGESPPFDDVNLLDLASREANAHNEARKAGESEASVLEVGEEGTHSGSQSTGVAETDASSQAPIFWTQPDNIHPVAGQQTGIGCPPDIPHTTSVDGNIG